MANKLAYVALSLILCIAGCNGNVGTQRGHLQPVIPAGNVQPFYAVIYNGSQFPIMVGTVILNNQAYTAVVPQGTSVTVPIGFLPSSMSVQAATYSTPVYYFPWQTQYLYVDYFWNTTSILFTFQ